MLHRDVGYLAVALTIAYAISGIAVNHIADWNSNYRVTKTFTTVAPIAATDANAIVATVMERLKLAESPRSSFQPDSNTVQLFYTGTTYHVDLPTGKVMVEATRSRPVLFEMNQLHLNHSKRAWTWIADIYALALLLLAITGLFGIKGRHGITRRGAWLTAAGMLPVVYWLAFLRQRLFSRGDGRALSPWSTRRNAGRPVTHQPGRTSTANAGLSPRRT